jgi:DNA polymerase-3 subunit epsilon
MITPDAAPTAPGSVARQDRPFSTTDFVVVDLETTGWDPQAARITEIAAARITGGDLRQVFSSLVAPGCPIPGQVAALTGITDALVAGAPEIAAVLPGFLEFARGAVLIAHNAPFDVGFLRAACQRSGLDWPDFTVLDTVAVARAALRPGEVPDCKLATLARYFGTAVRPSHRALADALATAGVLEALLARLAAAGVRTLAEISRLAEASTAAGAPWTACAGRLRRRTRLGRLRCWARRLARRAGGADGGAAG